MAGMKRGAKAPAKKPTSTRDEAEFDPMAIPGRRLPRLTKKQRAVVQSMFAGGATVKDVTAYLKGAKVPVDVLTVEDMIEADPDLRPKKAKKTLGTADGDRDVGGRPPVYEAKFADQAKVLASLGATDLEQSQFFGVAIRTLHRWKIEHPEFREALESGKDEADARVEKALYQRATGYTFDTEKVMVIDDEVVRVETLEHVPPDPKAAMFWLQNRRPGLWRSVNHIKHDVEPQGELAKWLGGLQRNGNSLRPIEDDPEPAAPAGTVPIAHDDEG